MCAGEIYPFHTLLPFELDAQCSDLCLLEHHNYNWSSSITGQGLVSE